MPIECFLDTNILMYAATARQDEPRKFSIADQLLSKQRFGLSAQVLAEFVVNFMRKPMTPPTTTEVDGWMDTLSKFPVVPVDESLGPERHSYSPVGFTCTTTMPPSSRLPNGSAHPFSIPKT